MANASFGDKSGPGGIVHNPASPYSREMAKWEMDYSPYGPPGRPRAQQPSQTWPALYYKVRRSDTNGSFIVEHYAEAKDEAEGRNFESRGYARGRAAAEAAVVALEQRNAVGAAERAFDDRRMSDGAKAEASLADAATSKHLPEVPVTPIRKRGRPVKVKKDELVAQS